MEHASIKTAIFIGIAILIILFFIIIGIYYFKILSTQVAITP